MSDTICCRDCKWWMLISDQNKMKITEDDMK